MDWKSLTLYLVGGAAFVGGVHLMFSEPPPEEADPVEVLEEELGGPVEIVDPNALRVGPGRVGTGHMGTGQPQVVMDLMPATDERKPRNTVVRDEDERAVIRRAEKLRPVLENLGGLPVYVEGVDDTRTDRDDGSPLDGPPGSRPPR